MKIKSGLVQKPREMLVSTPAGAKPLSAYHALQSARIVPRPRPKCPDGLPVSTSLAFCLEYSYEEICSKTDEKMTNITIIHKVPLREVARGVAQERNEKHPAWNEYHYAGNSRIVIVLI